LRAQRWILILQIDERKSLSVVGQSEPNDSPAQSIAAEENLDLDALVRVQPDADRRITLCADQGCGKQRKEQSSGNSTHDYKPVTPRMPFPPTRQLADILQMIGISIPICHIAEPIEIRLPASAYASSVWLAFPGSRSATITQRFKQRRTSIDPSQCN
jgi:hypothetical protein